MHNCKCKCGCRIAIAGGELCEVCSCCSAWGGEMHGLPDAPQMPLPKLDAEPEACEPTAEQMEEAINNSGLV